MKKLKLKRETIRVLDNLQLKMAAGGKGAGIVSATTDEMGACGTCGTVYCNTREDRDCWGTYSTCN